MYKNTCLLNKRLGFFFTSCFTLVENDFAYLVDFHLGIESGIQYFILFINPIATTLLLLELLFISDALELLISRWWSFIFFDIACFSNVTYYREFTDFITINTILGAGKVASGLGESAIRLFRPYDVIYWIDFIILTVLLIAKIKLDLARSEQEWLCDLYISSYDFLRKSFMAEADRPELLTRTFSRDYLVKYLGLNAFMVYDGVQTYQTNQVRAEASPNDMKEVENYVKNIMQHQMMICSGSLKEKCDLYPFRKLPAIPDRL